MPYLKPEEREKVYSRNRESLVNRIERMRKQRAQLNLSVEITTKAIRERYKLASNRAIDNMTYKIKQRGSIIREREKRHGAELRDLDEKIAEVLEEIKSEKRNKSVASIEGASRPEGPKPLDDKERAMQAKIDAAPALSKANSKAIDARSSSGRQGKHSEELRKIFGLKRNSRGTKRPRRKGRRP